jgi:hypothetical protein
MASAASAPDRLIQVKGRLAASVYRGSFVKRLSEHETGIVAGHVQQSHVPDGV